MGWLERVAGGAARGLLKVAVALVALGFVIASWVYLGNNQDSFNRVTQSAGDFGTTATTGALDWGTSKLGGDAATADVPSLTVVWVENKAPARWPVASAVKTWNAGLTSVELRLGKCQEGAPCIKVSEAKHLVPNDGHVTLGSTSHLLGTRVKFNGAAQVPGRYRTVSAVHELGHALGLDHSAARSSVMFATVSAKSAVRPSAADFAAVNKKYEGR